MLFLEDKESTPIVLDCSDKYQVDKGYMMWFLVMVEQYQQHRWCIESLQIGWRKILKGMTSMQTILVEQSKYQCHMMYSWIVLVMVGIVQ